MKNFTQMWLFTGFALLLNIAPAFAKDKHWEVNLPFETAIIHYDVSGSQKGKETLYIRDFGNERVKITKSKGKVMFVSIKTDTVEITTRDLVVVIDMDKRTGTKMTNPQMFMQEEMEKLSTKEREIVMNNLESMGMNLAAQMGGQVEPKASEHLGYTCDLVTVMGSTSCQMSGTPILLKMESNMMGIKNNTVAKKIDKNASVPADVFLIPKGVNVKFNQEADDMNRAMITSMIESMKDPEAAKKIEEGMAQGRMEMEEDQRQAAEERYQQDEANEDMGEESNEPDEKELNEMMDKGMKAFKGLFN